jgi:hypothetical protein
MSNGTNFAVLYDVSELYTRLTHFDWFAKEKSMRPHLSVIADSAGLPCAQVPMTSMWDLVEYLSYQRCSVTYQYKGTHFTVTFPRQDFASAQRVLDEWASVSEVMLQSA